VSEGETHGSFKPRELSEPQLSEIYRTGGRLTRTDAGLGAGRNWSRPDTERVVQRRYDYAVAAREYGEGPGSPAHARLESWRAAARVANKRAAKVDEARRRYDSASKQWWDTDHGTAVRFPIEDPKVGKDYDDWVCAGREYERLESGLGWEGSEEPDGDDRPRVRGAEHEVREYERGNGERVRRHLAKNPRKR